MLDNQTWSMLRKHLPPHTEKADAQLRTDLRMCLSTYIENRSNVLQGSTLAASVELYTKLEKDLRRAAATWKKIQNGPCATVPMPFDNLDRMVESAKSFGAGLRARQIKTVPVGQPFQEFAKCVANCLRRVNLNPTVNGRGYDTASNAASWFQEFMIALNVALPILLREPTISNHALSKKIMRAMQQTK